MHKSISTISLMALLFNATGCVPRTIQTNNTQTTIPTTVVHTHARETISSEPINHEPIVYQQPTIQQEAPTPTNIAPSTAGETYHFPTVQGSTITIQERSNGLVFPQYQGKIVLLEIFGQNCHFCKEEFPKINSLKQRYGDRIQIIGVQAQEPMSQADLLNFTQQFQLNFPVIPKNEATPILLSLQNKYEWSGVLPVLQFIKDGVTEMTLKGDILPYQELDKMLQELTR